MKNLYNGNISETLWRTNKDNVLRSYGYTYDDLNRLRNAQYLRPVNPLLPNTNLNPIVNTFNESMQYDKNGNIVALQRNGGMESQTQAPLIDNLIYNYDGNQLTKVDDLTFNYDGFNDGASETTEYTYDLNGNMTTDQNKGIVNGTNPAIAYNHLNLPTKIMMTGGVITYVYNALGQKISKTVNTTNTIPLSTSVTEYLGGFQYNNSMLQFFPTAEGYVKNTVVNGANTYDYIFNYTDHLGNIRLSYGIAPVTQLLTIFEENNYYPFGLKHETYNYQLKGIVNLKDDLLLVTPIDAKVAAVIPPAGSSKGQNVPNSGYQYKFQGQERQDELGLNWDSFKWRNYDYAIGRFMSVDPLAEDYTYNSPYAFAENRVVDGRELEGLEWSSCTSSDGKTVNLNLNVRLVNNSDGLITNEQMRIMADERKAVLTNSLGGKDSEGRTVIVNVTYDSKATIDWEYNNGIRTEGVDDFKGKTLDELLPTIFFLEGQTDKIGDSQDNRTQIDLSKDTILARDTHGNVIFDDKNARARAAQTGAHEDLHTAGNRHEDDKKNKLEKEQKKDKKNLGNKSAPGTNVLPIQRTEIINNIQSQQ